MNNDLITLRNKIDKIDSEIAKLLNERFLVVLEIGKVKKENKLEILSLKREEEVVKSVQNTCENLQFKQALSQIYKCVISECTKLQK